MIPHPLAGGATPAWRSVWPTAAEDLAAQLDRAGYPPTAIDDPRLVPPTVAAHAVAAYSRPGRIVDDPACALGTVAVAALAAGRHTIARTTDVRAWAITQARVSAAKHAGAPGEVLVLDPRGGQASWTGLPYPVDLVLTRVPTPSGPGPDPDWPVQLLTRYAALPRVGGRVVLITTPGPGADLAATLAVAGPPVGLIPLERCVALVRAARGGPLRHLDVIVFRRSARLRQAERQRRPRPLPRARPILPPPLPPARAA